VRRLRGLALLASALGMLAYTAARLEVGTDLTNFMPEGARSERAEVSTRLTDSPLTRAMVVTVGAERLETALAGAREIAAALAAHPGIAWARSGSGDQDLEPFYRLYFPRRHLLLSEDPEREIPALVSEEALRQRARELRKRLASPAAPVLARVAPADPLGAFERVGLRLRQMESVLASERGQWVTRDRRFAVVLAETRASAFDSGAQSRLLADLEAAKERASRELGADLVMELAGANRFAVAAEQSIKRDVYAIGAFSFLGVTALFAIFIGSLRGFLIVAVPPAMGILTATTLGLAVFGRLDGLTMVFGASLMGIAIDYSNHLLIHHGLAPGESARETVRRLRPSLVLAAFTTVASFGGLAATPFPAFREMSFFAAVGLLAALAVTLFFLPDWLEGSRLPRRSAGAASGLRAVLAGIDRTPRAVALLPGAAAVAALFALPGLEWQDDMSRLTSFDPAVVAEESRVRERVAGVDAGRFAVGIAPDARAAVALAERVGRRIEEARRAGWVAGSRSLDALVWSEDLQRRNWQALRSEPRLYERLDAAFAAEGFRPGAFRAFGDALAAGPPEPLRLEDLEASPLAHLLAPFLLPLGDGRVAVVTYLHGLERPEALAASLADLDGVYLLDQRSFVNDVYREFRQTTLRQMLVGVALVVALLALRYRTWRPVVAAVLPSLAVAVLVLAALALLGIPVTLLHVMALVMVAGLGDDYGIFLVDGARAGREAGATMLAALLSCLTTAFVFGSLALSSQPSLRAIGVTTGIGVLLSYLLAPLALVATGLGGRRR